MRYSLDVAPYSLPATGSRWALQLPLLLSSESDSPLRPESRSGLVLQHELAIDRDVAMESAKLERPVVGRLKRPATQSGRHREQTKSSPANQRSLGEAVAVGESFGFGVSGKPGVNTTVSSADRLSFWMLA